MKPDPHFGIDQVGHSAVAPRSRGAMARQAVRRETNHPRRAGSLDSNTAARNYPFVIQSFACRETLGLWAGRPSRKLPGKIQQAALRKLAMLDTAQTLSDLANPPGNRLDALKGNRKGQHSIRINDQWRLCFVWDGAGAQHVEIVDYH